MSGGSVFDYPVRHFNDSCTIGGFSDLWYPITMTRAKVATITTYNFDDLAIWRTRLPKSKHAILPPSNTRPNPFVVGDVIYVSVFSPGAVCALNRKTGRLIWRRGDSLALEAPQFTLSKGRYLRRRPIRSMHWNPKLARPFGPSPPGAIQANRFTHRLRFIETAYLLATDRGTFIGLDFLNGRNALERNAQSTS